MSYDSVIPVSSLGLTEVYAASDPQVDVVFVHGLNGHPEKTWTADNDVFWPRDLLPKHVGEVRLRVLMYGYDARSNKATERPIIFVVHSLGGLVTKQCLIYSRSIDHPNSEHLRSIFVSTYGILFMGTPHLGSDLAKWGTLLQSIASATLPRKFFDSSSHLVEALKSNNETLQNINRHFTDIQPQLKIYFFYEGRPMDLKGTRQFVVDEDSAAPNFPGVERMGIERDHSHMCKFEDERAPGFAVVSEAIQRYARDAPATTIDRWEEEHQVRAFQRQRRARRDLLPGVSQNSSRGTSPDSRSRSSATPLLPSNERPVVLLENSPATYQPYEIEEHEGDLSKVSSSTRLPHRTLADSTNSSTLKSPAVSSPSMTLPKLIRPMVVAPLGFRPNTDFIGFDIEMARIVKKLADERRGQIGARSVLLHGPPGCGKSHLARQYLWQHVEQYPNGIFWLDCKTPESLMKGFWNVSQSLGCYEEVGNIRPDTFVDAVRTHLAQKDKWLMVFDGITFPGEYELEDFKRFVPDGKGSSIIYTTVDPTLANRQRLLDPPGIKLYPLSVDQACLLLFRSLHSREDRPKTSVQLRKARELVKHYQCLPLGVHAAAHALIASGRPLEKFSVGPSGHRLSSPFLSILDSLRQTQQVEAVNLLMLMCFLNHEVPVVMLQLGRKILADAGVEIRTMEYEGSTRRELDLSISTLIKNGLIERRLQTQASSSGGRSSPEETRAGLERQNSVPVDDMHDQDERDSQNSPATIVGIDVIRVHTVVQKVYLDHLKSQARADFNAWLVIAAKFVIGAWNVSCNKAQMHRTRALVADCREFESQAESVWSHFPSRSDGAMQDLRRARHDLHDIRRIIKREIENQSPSQSSQSSGRNLFVSIFERSGSSSDEGPETPTSGLTRKSTWSNDPFAPSVESPVDYQGPPQSNIPIPLGDSWYSDTGYLSDDEQRPAKGRTTSTSTEKALDERQLALRAIFEGRGSIDSEAYRPTPVVGAVSVTDIEPHHSRSNSTTSQGLFRPDSAGSLAEAALSAVHRSSPPSSKGGSRASPQREERRPLSELSSNSQLSQRHIDSRLSRTTSTSPHLLQAVLASTVRREQPFIEENISVARRSKPTIITGKPFVPTLPTLESHSLPTEYAIPMARDPSHESTTSVQTEPAEQSAVQHVDDAFLTPAMSPLGPQSPLTSIRQPSWATPARSEPSVIDTSHGYPPYPLTESQETEPLSIVSPRIAAATGLGIVSEMNTGLRRA
ncbi:hypothetical protein LTR64_000868 [Lithohypha guttulata]|uniref:uncharacterized protein n=1 Tax=Lithohypha guttulata TaxID=1690604 RepID=UPI002DDDE59C|nr:hypothetical protein LTR51_003063 [Lithohypha guttulata]